MWRCGFCETSREELLTFHFCHLFSATSPTSPNPAGSDLNRSIMQQRSLFNYQQAVSPSHNYAATQINHNVGTPRPPTQVQTTVFLKWDNFINEICVRFSGFVRFAARREEQRYGWTVQPVLSKSVPTSKSINQPIDLWFISQSKRL